jgi:hypothetical protein
MSLASKILHSKKPFSFFHTWTVSEELLQQAIAEGKSMDLDVCVDDAGKPYLGHSREYHEKSGEPYFNSLPLWEVVERIADSNIAAMIDCKHYDAWPVIAEVVAKIGPERCLVGGMAEELKFGHSRADGEPDFLTEWSPIERLLALKKQFPAVTTTTGAKWPPVDLLSDKYEKLVEFIRSLLVANQVEVFFLCVPEGTITDHWLRYFLEENILCDFYLDGADFSKLTEIHVGETDYLERASKVSAL